MRYIMIIILSLSLSALALESRNVPKDSENTSNVLKKIYKTTEKPCDPEKTLHMIPFN